MVAVMPVTSAELWKLLQDSRLVPPAHFEQVESVFERAIHSADQVTTESLVALLLQEDLLTRYQASQLMYGRGGPFVYGDYQIQDRIREGRLSGLFQAVHGPTQFPVLLKFASSRIAQDPRQWSIARQYHRSTVALIHPHLQRVYALEDCAGHRFLVLEELTGDALEQVLEADDCLPPTEASCIIHMAALALSEIHERRQAFGDLRPANMWLEVTGNLKLLRDGILPPVMPDFSRMDLPEVAVIQANYAAPELVHPGTSLSPRTDIYALGCTFYHLLTGIPPFPGRTARETLERHANEPIAPLEPHGVPASLAAIVARMMAKNPGMRPASARDVVAQLAPFVELPTDAYRTAPSLASSLRDFELAIAQPTTRPPAPPPIVTNLPDHLAQPIAARTVPCEPLTRAQATAPPPEIPCDVQPVAMPPVVVAGPTDRAPSLRARRSRRVPRTRALTLCVLAGALLALAATYLLWDGDTPAKLWKRGTSSTAVRDTRMDGSRAKSDLDQPSDLQPGSVKTLDIDNSFELREDDGQLLWMTPVQGPSIQLAHLPPGAQLILVVRPHALASSESGQRLLQAIDLELSGYRQQWEAAAGCSLEQIEQLVVSWRNVADELQRPTCVVSLREPRSEEQLLAMWGHPTAEAYEGTHYFSARGWSFYVPHRGDHPPFVMGEEEAVREVIALHGAPPTVRREMAQLLATSNAQHHLTLVGVPHFIYVDVLQGSTAIARNDARRLQKGLEWLLGDQFTACQLGAYLGDPAYVELRGYGRTTAESPALAEALGNRLRELPDRIENHFQHVYPSPYWRQVALRVPEMLHFLADYTRVGVENNQVIVNSVLPPAAPHNLVFAGGMLLSPDDQPTDPPADPLATAAGPQTLEELLETKMSFRFAAQSLELALRDLTAAVRANQPALPFPFDIQILGGDLQSDGITRNQQIVDFQAEEQPLAEILTALVMRANPDSTVTKPSDTMQKLVWVRGADPEDANRQILLITTRDAVTRRGDALPAAFQPK
ncbi:MAG: serine/threonine-protein kinase [Pirellulaceae bacterium]